MTERGCNSVGIDLGTTYSAMAYMDGQMVPRMVQDTSGQAVIPSVIYFDEQDVIVGDIALQQAKLHSERIVQFIKIHMGDEWKREFNGQVHTPESLSGIILAHLIREAEPQIGPVPSAVITVPAYFTEKRRRATQQAGEIAGLQVVGTLNEPMAAALAFGLYRADREQTAVVYDLGGGTFDVTVVRIGPNELVELATYGNRQLGGRDWDEALIHFVADDFQRHWGKDPRDDPQALQDLRIVCEEAKRRLGRMRQTSVRLHASGHDHSCSVTREEFERITAPLLQTTKLTTQMALEDARLSWNDISRVVLVGGSTHMPMVRNMLKDISGKNPDTGVNPVLAVALGAAQYAWLLESGTAPRALHQQKRDEEADELQPAEAGRTIPSPPPLPPVAAGQPRVGFVTAHGVGVKAYVRGEKANVVLIHKNAQVPCEVSRIFKTTPNSRGETRSQIPIEVTQGDTPHIELAEVLGAGRITGIPPDDPPGQPVKVTMAFDEQGRLHVAAVYLNTGRQLDIDLQVPGGLAQEEVDEYRQLLESSGLVPPTTADPLLKPFDEDDNTDDDEWDDDDEDIPLLQPLD